MAPLNKSFFLTNNVKFIGDVEFSGSDQIKKVNFEKKFDNIFVVATEHIWYPLLLLLKLQILRTNNLLSPLELLPIQDDYLPQ